MRRIISSIVQFFKNLLGIKSAEPTFVPKATEFLAISGSAGGGNLPDDSTTPAGGGGGGIDCMNVYGFKIKPDRLIRSRAKKKTKKKTTTRRKKVR